jgi:hypothetical protein
VLVSLGDALGFYRALAAARLTPAELAEKTGAHERYARAWLGNQAAGGYVDYGKPTPVNGESGQGRPYLRALVRCSG